jgi:hypothetical protein
MQTLAVASFVPPFMNAPGRLSGATGITIEADPHIAIAEVNESAIA